MRGATVYNGLPMVRSHLRLERCVAEGMSERQAMRLAERAVEQHGFVVLFTHEVDLGNEQVRSLAAACIGHLTEQGVQAL